MMCLSNRKAEKQIWVPSVYTSQIQLKGWWEGGEKNHVGPDSTRRARCVTWQEVEFILLYKTGGIFTPLLHKRFS